MIRRQLCSWFRVDDARQIRQRQTTVPSSLGYLAAATAPRRPAHPSSSPASCNTITPPTTLPATLTTTLLGSLRPRLTTSVSPRTRYNGTLVDAPSIKSHTMAYQEPATTPPSHAGGYPELVDKFPYHTGGSGWTFPSSLSRRGFPGQVEWERTGDQYTIWQPETPESLDIMGYHPDRSSSTSSSPTTAFQFRGNGNIIPSSTCSTAFSFRLECKDMSDADEYNSTNETDNAGGDNQNSGRSSATACVHWSDTNTLASLSSGGTVPSLEDSLHGFVIEDNRRFHGYHDGRYAFPNDELEQSRDEIKHEMTLLLCEGKLHFAPIEEAMRRGGRALDLCTGTGSWAIDMGDKYPQAEIEGWDLSPIQPASVPPNVKFLIEDIEVDWVGEENHYDYIHVRHSIHSIKDPAALIANIYKYLKPGGYVEFQDISFTPTSDDSTVHPSRPYRVRDFFQQIELGLRRLGSECNGILSVGEALRNHGGFLLGPPEFPPSSSSACWSHELRCPLGEWPADRRLRRCGELFRDVIYDGLRGLTVRTLGEKGLGWEPAEIEVFLAGVREDLRDPRFHAWMPLFAIYAKKPEEGANN